METYYGHVRTPADAIILFEACRIGLLPRVQRRLSEKERQSIRSGSVFVWDEREAGMRRWTDGKSWSASRVSGSFLTYREMEGKRGGGSVSQSSVSRAGKTPESTRGSDEDRGDGTDEGPDGYRYKPDGLMKQSFSITTSTGQHLHLISYYSRSHPSAANLQQPTTDPALRHVRPQKGLYPESTVNDQQNLPVVTRGPMAGATAYPITPHPMGSYARTTHAPNFTPPSYAWPPTPLATPPTVAVPPPFTICAGATPTSSTPSRASAAASLPPSSPPPHSMHGPYDRPAHPDSTAPPSALPPGYPGRSPRSTHEVPLQQRSPRYAAGPDPRLVSPRVLAGAIPQPSSIAQSPHILKQTPPTAPQQLGPISTPPKPIEANGVPGIGALVSGTSLAPISAMSAPSGGPGSPPSVPSSRPGIGDGPRDIPNEKLGFGDGPGREDIRLLRQLDRVFTA
ncbi:hypothetical protein N7532_004251 [Penicillium argentinense]|uniref:cAMP-independent regulatory protein pac2 n=1 Tax=Penicillium argentinense TaxID=1131581 RepID=A0A9W9FP02_9EURO|nr:uncharacterized protein N7532_004251 [Penicillium argentinense]KAJ5103722.1 hypothetical protein N7532_004251 [Penicillium argentinense]